MKRTLIVSALILPIAMAAVFLFAIKVNHLKPILKRNLSLVLGRKLQPPPELRLPPPKTPNTHLYPNSAYAHKDLDAALAAAQADHKRVLIIFGANWCYDCQVLDSAMRASQLVSLVAANYYIVHVNVDDGNSNTDLANHFKVPLNKGIPSLAVVGGSGELITSQKHGEFESSAMIGMNDVSAFLNRWKPGPASP